MEVDLYPLFGGYEGYMKAPLDKVRRHQLRWIATREYEAEQQKVKAAKEKELQDELDRLNAQYEEDDDE